MEYLKTVELNERPEPGSTIIIDDNMYRVHRTNPREFSIDKIKGV